MFNPLILLCLLTPSTVATPSITITEIMYDPASPERKGEPEWVELMNTGSTAVDLAGWRLDDEDTTDWGLLSGTLAPGAVAVVINGDAGTAAEFHSAWGEDPDVKPGYLIIPVQWGSLANKPTAENEVLDLIDAEGETACTVNYARGGEWPDPGRNGQSIHLTSLKPDAQNSGSNWALTTADSPGARTARASGVFTRPDIGSPGVVPTAPKSPQAPTGIRAPRTPKSPSTPKSPPAPRTPETPQAPEAPKAPEAPEAPEDDVPY